MIQGTVKFFDKGRGVEPHALIFPLAPRLSMKCLPGELFITIPSSTPYLLLPSCMPFL